MNITPEIIILVPYRDRKEHYNLFSAKIHQFLNPWNHLVLYIHQNDTRSFNRGAIKNIGFLVVRQMFPNSYKNITLVFNDIDSIPVNTQLNYKTTQNKVKHFYGFRYTLGGIVSIIAEDFERIGGFPNYWGWGYEDNMLLYRCISHKLQIDRSQFYPCGSPNILRLNEAPIRHMNSTDYAEYMKKTDDGWKNIANLEWVQEGEFIHVNKFTTGREENENTKIDYNIRYESNPLSSKKFSKLIDTIPPRATQIKPRSHPKPIKSPKKAIVPGNMMFRFYPQPSSTRK